MCNSFFIDMLKDLNRVRGNGG